MMQRKHVLLALIFALISHALATENDTPDDPCRLWLALSSLSTSSAVKYGLYAGVDFEKDDIIPDIELAIPYVDFFMDYNRDTSYSKGILDYLESQMWTPDYSIARFEGNITTSPFLPGVGTLGNYHSLTSNADWLMAASLLKNRDDITKPGKPHLSRGAISNVDNMTMVATTKIPAGMEIFPNFGDLWDKEEPSPYQDRLTRRDIIEADNVLDRIVDFYDRFESKLNENLKEDMLDFMLDKILGAAGGTRAAIIRSLIPQNYRKLRQVKDAGGVFLYRFKDMLKKPKWLQRHGVCVDTMYPGKSTIPEAGRGAFASKNFAQGDRITIIPTLLFGKKELMNMYDIVVHRDPPSDDASEQTPPASRYVYDPSKPRGQQIGINYAFGHPESSFLFLPTSPMVNFVNHRDQPNAQLQWSSHEIMPNDQAAWDYSVEEVMNFRSNMVLFELEALEDIQKGDEIFIDYQSDWQEAWEDYRQMWEREHANRPWPLRAEDVKKTFLAKPYPTESKGNYAVLPAGVMTACYIQNSMVPDGTPAQTDDGMTIQQWVGPLDYKNYTGTLLNLCELKDLRDDGFGSFNYTITTRMDVEGQIATTQVNNVPHAAITVIDGPYQGDMHFEHAFRHSIGIPDDIFPQNWRDLR